MTSSIRRYGVLILLATSLMGSLSLPAQQPPPVPRTVEEALHQMSDLAGVIFVGEVTAVRHRQGEQGASGVVEIDFRIDQAVRGCASNSTFTLREWAGLWAGGDERYRPGQRLLMLLHSPSPSGITSPVGGMDGVIPIRAANTSTQDSAAPLASASTTTAADPLTGITPLVADLRWIGARILRSAPYISTVSATSQVATTTTDTIDTAPQQSPVSTVVEMLNSWQQTLP